jgi:CheY-like chemotaxis protein
MSQKYQDVAILLVDDDEVDVRAFRRALQKQQISNPVINACDGIEALKILRGEEGHAKLPRPNLILLDINMPRMNGIQFLQEIRKDPGLTDSIVFVLSTSANDEDQTAAYKQHIAGYLLKAEAGENFIKVVQMLEKFVITVQFPAPQP